MSTVVNLQPRAESVTALLLEDGVTSAVDIEAFCGEAHVNVGRADRDDRDLRWIHVTTPTGAVEAGYGDWLVKLAPGVLFVAPRDPLVAAFAPATDGDAERMRRALRPDPMTAVATALARSLRER